MNSDSITNAREIIITGVAAAVALASVYTALTIINFRNVAEALHEDRLATVQVVQAPQERVPGLLRQINTYRATHDLPALKLNDELSNSAQAKSDDLVERQYFSHYRDDETPWDYIEEAGYQYVRAGENLAKCYKSPEAIVKAWINSPAHREILLSNYQDAGFGTTTNATGCAYVTGHFGSRS